MVTHYIHRGLVKKNFKENTLSSFRYAFKKKYGIETDIHSTKDDQLICFHDFSLNKLKINKKITNVDYSYIKKISIKKKAKVPLLKDLLKVCKNRYPLLLEIKPFFKNKNLKDLIKLLKKSKKYGIISFKEKNLINLYKLDKKLPLGLLLASTTTLKNIKIKSKKKHIKFLVLEKKFLPNKKLGLIRKNIYYYTIKNKALFEKYKNSKNLIFENL